MPDRQLYRRPRAGNILASPTENTRVRVLYQQMLDDEAYIFQRKHPGMSDEVAYGHARDRLARRWVAQARECGLHWPGEQARTHGRTPAQVHAAWVDAAHTELRNFQTGTDLYAWMLHGIEAAYCWRYGLPLPGYDVQATLDVEPPPLSRHERTQARNRELVGLYSSGWPQARLAAKYHLAPATVKRIILSAEGHVRRPRRRP